MFPLTNVLDLQTYRIVALGLMMRVLIHSLSSAPNRVETNRTIVMRSRYPLPLTIIYCSAIYHCVRACNGKRMIDTLNYLSGFEYTIKFSYTPATYVYIRCVIVIWLTVFVLCLFTCIYTTTIHAPPTHTRTHFHNICGFFIKHVCIWIGTYWIAPYNVAVWCEVACRHRNVRIWVTHVEIACTGMRF